MGDERSVDSKTVCLSSPIQLKSCRNYNSKVAFGAVFLGFGFFGAYVYSISEDEKEKEKLT